MEQRTMSLPEIRQRFDSHPYSQESVRRRTRWAAILASLGALLCAVFVGLLEPGWHVFVVLTAVLLAAMAAWCSYFQLDQREAMFYLVDHIERLEERLGAGEPVNGGVE